MMQPDDPPFLTVGTEVSAKYKGAFCEAKVNKVVKYVKVKVTYKHGLGSHVVTDDSVKGILKVGAEVKALNSEKGTFVDSIVNKIQDCSQYTVVFDDGDITTLRRTSLCLKSGRHFAESETLDQLPLTHPEHFGTPVVGGRRGRRTRPNHDSDDGSSEDEDVSYKKQRRERESDIGKVLCVEIGDKKKQKDNWFPGLVVAPTAQDSVKIDVKKDYLVRSFQDGRYYTVPKKESFEFTKEVGSKVTQTGLKAAVEKAYQFLDNDQLPPHWDREILFGNDLTDDESFNSDSDISDDEPREEKDHFVAQLYKHMEECGTPINKEPTIGNKDLDLYKLFKIVQKLGGYNRVANQNHWKHVAAKMGFQVLGKQAANLTKSAYKNYLQSFDDLYRKLGCTMVSDPRSSRTRHRSGRSLIRDCDRAPRKKKSADSGESADDADKKDDKEESKKQEKEIDKKTDLKPVRNKISPVNIGRMSPSQEKTREMRNTTKIELRHSIQKKEEVKVKKEESASEEESETMMTRSHRNREESKDKEEVKKSIKRPRDTQRSTSCNSTSSTASCSSGSQTADASRNSEKRIKITRGVSISTPEELKKRGRKRKAEDGGENTSVKKVALPASVPVNINDKLLVLYGPNNKETKVTYEAKVLKVDKEDNPKMFYVHYRGWNIRYDEWVDRERIAQNLTWRQTRPKKQPSDSATKLEKSKDIKNPKKITKSERTASPALKSTTLKRARSNSTSSKEFKEDKVDNGSCSSSVGRKSDTQNESKQDTAKAVSTPIENSETDDLESEVESEKESLENTPDATIIRQESEQTTSVVADTPKQPCGKDIDFKTIESEMKGLEKPRKDDLSLKEGRIISVIPGSLTIIEKKASDSKTVGIPVRLVPAHEVIGQIKPRSLIKKEPLLEDDIYEFKEPEPFEMGEIRSRKDSKSKSEDDIDLKKLPKSEDIYSPAKVPEVKDSSEPTLKIEPNKELKLKLEPNKDFKDYSRKVEHKEKVEMKKKENEFLLGTGIEILNQGKQADYFWKPGADERIDLMEHFDVDSCLFDSPKKLLKKRSEDFESKIDPVPIKSDEPDILSLLKNSEEPIKSLLTPKKSEKTPVKSSRISLSPGTSVPSPTLDTRKIKSLHKDERFEGKLVPFSQRQQHIFPHLLNYSDNNDDKEGNQKEEVSGDQQPEVPPLIIGPFGPHRPPVAKYENKKFEKAEEKQEKLKPDTSVEETIEAVVLKARHDQMQAEENNKTDFKNTNKNVRTESTQEKRRKNPARIKKSFAARDYPDSSEDSDLDAKYENERNKKIKSESAKYLTGKRLHRLSSEAEKSLACDEEERANDADNEDNENNQEKDNNLRSEELDRIVKTKKKRRTSKKSDSEETLGDLLCEETLIPGSPVAQDSTPVDISGISESTKQEMPFASVPTGSSFGKLHGKESLHTSTVKDVPLIKKTEFSSEKTFASEKLKNKPIVESEIKQKIDSHSSCTASSPYHIPASSSVGVIDNTPPTTPESISSNITDSPQRENESSKADETSKSGQSSELEFDNKLELSEGWDTEDGSNSSIMCKRNQKHRLDDIRDCSEVSVKRKKIHLSPPHTHDMHHGLAALQFAIAHRSGSSKFNFCQELDPDMDTTKRISTLQNRMHELRKTYLRVKTELAAVERRRKKLRKKIRDKEAVEDAS